MNAVLSVRLVKLIKIHPTVGKKMCAPCPNQAQWQSCAARFISASSLVVLPCWVNYGVCYGKYWVKLWPVPLGKAVDDVNAGFGHQTFLFQHTERLCNVPASHSLFVRKKKKEKKRYNWACKMCFCKWIWRCFTGSSNHNNDPAQMRRWFNTRMRRSLTVWLEKWQGN